MGSWPDRAGFPRRCGTGWCGWSSSTKRLTTEERQRLKQLERENLELRRPNEILKKAAALAFPLVDVDANMVQGWPDSLRL